MSFPVDDPPKIAGRYTEITEGELNTNNSEHISENTKDYSSDVNWIYEKNYEVDMSSGDTLYNFL